MSQAQGFALFDTAVGVCAIAWNDRGVAGVSLPGANLAATFRKRYPGAHEAEPPPPIAAAIARIKNLLDGERDDLVTIELDLEGIGTFERDVYAVARAIPPGQTKTYGEVATVLGTPGAARAVGQALGANPFPIIVPCHRVLAAGAKAGGFSAPGGVTTKMKMLTIEGANPTGAPTLFDSLPLVAKPPRRP